MTTNIEQERAAFEKWFSGKSHALSTMARNDSESSHQTGRAAHVVEQEPVAWIEHHKAGDNLNWQQVGKDDSPLYASPQPASADDARDAARYRHLRDTNITKYGQTAEECDANIDRARSSAK